MINGRKIIALCISGLGITADSELITALNEEAVKNGHCLFVYNLCSDLFYLDSQEIAEVHLYDLIDFEKIDVLALAVEDIGHRKTTEMLINSARKNGVPIITLDVGFSKCLNLGFDYKLGFEKIVRHITDFHGITDIHFMSGYMENACSDERRAVLEKVLAEKGIVLDESRISYGNFWEEPTRKAAQKLVDSEKVPKAIICANDVMAVAVCSVLKANGIRVPEDVIVTGFDGIDEIYLTTPRITSVNCSRRAFGRKIAEAADEIFRTGRYSGNRFIEPELIIGDSCGCSENNSIDVTAIMQRLNNRINRIQEDNRVLAKRCEKIQNSSDFREVSSLFNSAVFSDITCVINRRFLTPTAEPFSQDSRRTFDDEMVVLSDSGSQSTEKLRVIRQESIAPELERLMDKKCPLVFSVISYLNVPTGYVIFHYDYEDHTYYCRVPSVVNALNNAIGGCISSRSLHYLMERMEKMYRTDALTGLCNRRSFAKEYDSFIRRMSAGHRKFTAAFADLDDLKGINDSFGHVVGDMAIKMVAEALSSACTENALIVRLGGDEMLAVMEGEVDEESIREGVNRYLSKQSFGRDFRITASVGIFTEEATEELKFESLIKRADELMYAEKRRKKNSGA